VFIVLVCLIVQFNIIGGWVNVLPCIFVKFSIVHQFHFKTKKQIRKLMKLSFLSMVLSFKRLVASLYIE